MLFDFRFVKVIPQDSLDGSFYRAILAIHKEQYKFAQDFIDLSRDLIDNELTTMASESYQRAYGAMVHVQMLSELEEVRLRNCFLLNTVSTNWEFICR